MHRNNKKRKIVIYSLLGVLLLMVVGYASFQSSLKIKGSSKVTSNWDVEITNITKGTFSGSAEEATVDGVKVDPTCSDSGTPKLCNKLTADINVDLYEVGDSAEYDITISNKGDIDAKLDDIITDNTNSNSAVLITFSGYSKGERLFKRGSSGSSKTVHVKVSYNPEYTGNPTSSEINLTFNFVQAEAGTIPDTNTYTLTYDYQTNGGSKANESANYDEGENVDLTHQDNDREGYRFIGWNTDSSATSGLATFVMPSSNTNLYAIYEALDQTPPVIDNISTTKTPTSITVVATAHDDETGITKYEFSSDNGSTWVDNGTNGTYTFTNLTMGQTYSVKVRVTNGAGGKTTSDALEVTPNLPVATFIEYISPRYKTTVEITYPEECSNGTYTCTYKKNSDAAAVVDNTNLTDNKISVEFTDSGTIIGTVSDGTNTVSSSYTVVMSAVPITPSITISKLGQDVVTEGDGLYEDDNADDDVAYLYRGADPANYIMLDSDLYRIMSIDTSGNIKLIKDTPLSSIQWDPGYSSNISGITSRSSTAGTRYSSDATDYCYTPSPYSYNGCKSWGSKTSTLNSAGTSAVTQMPWEAGSTTLYNLPEYDSYINVYLNGGTYGGNGQTANITSWYSTNVASSLQSKLVTHLWNIGPVAADSSLTLAENIGQEAAYKWSGKVGLMTSTDYVRASTNSACTNVYNYRSNSTCYNNSSTHNWLYKSLNQWTMAPLSTSSIASNVYRATSTYLRDSSASNSYRARPVLYLSSCINLTGSGTIDDAFEIVEDATCSASSSQTTNVNDKDSQRPILSTSHTSNSITATMNTSNVIGNITKYEFSKDNGATWQESNNNVYEYTGLLPNTYKVVGRVTKESGEVLVTDPSKVTIEPIDVPTYNTTYGAPDGNVYGDVTITYPSGCGSTFTCTYTKDNNAPVTVTSDTAVIRFTSDGELAASVSDGTNTVGSSLTVKMPEAVKMGNVYVPTAFSGDGLYKDDKAGDDVAYLYRGADPANYIKLGSDLYRIMSIDTAGNLKVIKDTPLSSIQWDPGYSSNISGITSSSSTAGTRYSSTSTDYCYTPSSTAYIHNGCKSWGSKTSTLNSAGTSAVTQMPWEAGSTTLYNLPEYDSYINVYLNGGTYPTESGTTTLTSWYSSNVASSLQSKLVTHLWNIGPVKSDSSLTLAQNIEQEAAYKWSGKVGLMTSTDYVRASTNSACTNVYNYQSNSTCYNNSSTHNWLYESSNQWTMMPYSNSLASSVMRASSENLTYSSAYDRYVVRPVLYLSSDIRLKGQGTADSPYYVYTEPTSAAKATLTKLGQTAKEYGTTDGDGIYEDNEGGYYYRGANPANYINLGSDLYRIMEIDKDGNLKVIKDTPLSSMVWDPGYSSNISGITSSSSTAGTRYSSTSTDYCYVSSTSSYYGCKSWGSNTSTLNSAGTSTVTQMPWEAGSTTLKNLPTYDSYINVYLNGGTYPTSSGTTTLTSWYSTNVASSLQSKLVTHLWNIGPVAPDSSLTLDQNIGQEAAYKWSGKVGLMTATDYARASTNTSCSNVYNYWINSCSNWLYKSATQWTMAPYSRSSADGVWGAYSDKLNYYSATPNANVVRPVLYLSSSTSITGSSGTSGSPFTAS